jgi:hypothetical protein
MQVLKEFDIIFTFFEFQLDPVVKLLTGNCGSDNRKAFNSFYFFPILPDIPIGLLKKIDILK